MTAPIIAGAEPWSADGTNGHGALVLHGFTGNCSSMRGLAEAFHAAGYRVELPLLPGHGTAIEDMLPTTWADWSAAAEDAYQRLAARVDRVVVAGLSMGGSLTCWLAVHHPEISGIVCINPATRVNDDVRALVTGMLDAGETVMAGIGADIADPAATESAYEGVPLAPLLSLFAAADELGSELAEIKSPLLLFTSPQDHVVPPTDSDHLAANVSGPVERISCERSYHVATLDHDKDMIEQRAVAFADEVTG